jgi:pimeloyl-ACP methyl ester carboxylesterase
VASEVLQFGDCEVKVDQFGKGQPLILLHGEIGVRNALPFAKELAKRFHTHVVHQVGWPGTRRGHHVNSIRDVALISQECAERLGEPVTVVGLSLGGWIAAEIAVNAPSLVTNLVLISPIGIKVGGREERDFADLYLLPDREREALYYAPGRLPPLSEIEGGDIYLEKAIADAAVARYCWQPYMHDPALKTRLRRIRANSLILSGGKDAFVLNPNYYREFARLIPGARHTAIGAAGHRVEEEEPKKVAEEIAAFVAAPRSVQTEAA